MQILARAESCHHTYRWRDTGRCGTTEAEAETIWWENCSRGRCTGTGNTEDGGGPQELELHKRTSKQKQPGLEASFKAKRWWNILDHPALPPATSTSHWQTYLKPICKRIWKMYSPAMQMAGTLQGVHQKLWDTTQCKYWAWPSESQKPSALTLQSWGGHRPTGSAQFLRGLWLEDELSLQLYLCSL